MDELSNRLSQALGPPVTTDHGDGTYTHTWTPTGGSVNEQVIEGARRNEEKTGEIKVFKNKNKSEIRFGEGDEYLKVSAENAEDIFGKLFNAVSTLRIDLAAVLAEYDRFRANYKAGLDILENFYMHNSQVLPRRTSDELRDAIAHMKGLL